MYSVSSFVSSVPLSSFSYSIIKLDNTTPIYKFKMNREVISKETTKNINVIKFLSGFLLTT